MQALLTAASSHTRIVMMFLVMILVGGINTYLTIPRESTPDVTIPVIMVTIVHEGISPEDAERMLVMPMENELRSIEGLKEITSTASQSVATIMLEFVAGLDVDKALDDVREKVDLAKSDLPADTEDPIVDQISFASMAPVLTAVLSGPLPERALIKIAQELQDQLESRREILEVDIGGDREDVVDVILDPAKLETYGLVPADVMNMVAQNNRLVAAGDIDNGRGHYSIKVPAVYKTPEDILNQPIKADGDRVITIGDVATVLSTFKEGGGYARMNGMNSVALEIKKRPGENIIETVIAARAIIDAVQKIGPKTLQVDYVGDASVDIIKMVADLENSVLSAIILVITIIVGALGVRSAFLSVVAIPGSFLMGILIIGGMGLTVNMVVLVALMIAVGMLVDGAIVVTEYADRKMSEGLTPKEAYLEASVKMSWPIISSTATTLAAFFPLMFWPGVIGEMMVYLPLTLIATLSASMLMALVFIPTIGAMIGKPRVLSERERIATDIAEKGDVLTLEGALGHYIKMLHKALQTPRRTIAMGLGLVFALYFAFGAFGKGFEFFPDVETNNITITIKDSSSNLSVDEKDKVLKQVENIALHIPEIKTLYARTGERQEIGTIRITLVDWQYRRRAVLIAEDLEKDLDFLKGLDISIERQQDGPPSGKPLELVVSANSLEELYATVAQVRGKIESMDGFINVTDDGPTPGYEWRITVNRSNAARYGADVSSAGTMILLATSGLPVGSYRPDDSKDEVDIRIRFPRSDRHMESINQMRLMSRDGLVPLSNFITTEITPKVDTITHLNGRRAVTIGADLADGVLLNDILPKMNEQLKTLNLPDGVAFQLKGESEDQKESADFLSGAFSAALFVMTMILVAQFNSFYQAALIMSAVVLSTGGVLLGLLITAQPFGIVMCGIGVIALAGIVVNNNIILIDTYNEMRNEGMLADEAILRTCAQRLRPVMLTTVTTILGLMPMVLSTNIDIINHRLEIGGPTSQWWSQLSTALAGGLTFATILTLVLTPCMLVIHGRRQDRKNAQHPSGITLP